MSLSLLPGMWPYFTQLDAFQVPAWLTPATGACFTGLPRMPSASAATLLVLKLPRLQHLAIANDALSQVDFFSQLQCLSALTSLDLLTGAPVQPKPLQVGRGLSNMGRTWGTSMCNWCLCVWGAWTCLEGSSLPLNFAVPPTSQLLGTLLTYPPCLQLLSSLTSLRELRLQPALSNNPEALEEHALMGLTQLRKLGVRWVGLGVFVGQ
jgi:hypothetical protein